MKRILFFWVLSAFFLTLVSCSDDLTYKEGEEDIETCYHVFFPEDQDVSGEISITPSASKELVIVAKREVTTGAIDVPVEIESGAPQYFSVGTLSFAEGSDESTVTVTIADNTPLDTLLSCSVKVSDPQYASIYGQEATYHDFDLIIENYDLIGTAKFSDSLEGIENTPVSLYQKHGENLFRIAEWPYTELFEYYAQKYSYDAISEMHEVSARYIYFSLDGNTVAFQSWNVEYYDSDAGTILTAFRPSDLSSSLANLDAYSTLSEDRKTVTFYPYYYITGVGGYGPYPATLVMDSVSIPEI